METRKAFGAVDIGINASFEIRAEADFYAPLEEVGTWVDVDSYGRCWRPTRVSANWSPYIDGHWVWTDYGWYWVSDEPCLGRVTITGGGCTIRAFCGYGCQASNGLLLG